MKVLLVEDSMTAAELVQDMLFSFGEITHATRLGEAQRILGGKDRFDVILLDLGLPDSQGLNTLDRVRERAPEIPIVILTSLEDETVALQALEKGAQDYLVKGEENHRLLSRILRYAIGRRKIEGHLGESEARVREAEEKLRKASAELKAADDLKTEFLSAVSHEMLTPLTSIREGTSQVVEGILGDVNENQKQFLSNVIEDVDRLTGIINDLVDSAWIETGKMEIRRSPLDIVKTARKVASSFRPLFNKKKLNLLESYSRDSIEIYGDEGRIAQIFTNLLNNAFKFTKEGNVQLSVMDRGDSVECSVIDTGQGIEKGELARVFDKFQQFGRQEGPGTKGTGLGLYIVKNLIKLHGGEVAAESQLNKGTKITFKLPKYLRG